jgi:hypothetical protein
MYLRRPPRLNAVSALLVGIADPAQALKQSPLIL